MKVSLKEIYSQVEPWELELDFGDEVLRVRRLDNTDMARLQKLGRDPAKQADDRAFLLGLLEAPPADPEAFAADQTKVTLVISASLAYVSSFLRKKAMRAAELVTAAAARSASQTGTASS